MMIGRQSRWRWIPSIFVAESVQAPYRYVIYIGYWLIFLGKRHDH